MNDEIFMKEAIRLSQLAVSHGNEPFGAVLVKDGEIIFSNENQIYTGSDPTFHAEAGLLRRSEYERSKPAGLYGRAGRPVGAGIPALRDLQAIKISHSGLFFGPLCVFLWGVDHTKTIQMAGAEGK